LPWTSVDREISFDSGDRLLTRAALIGAATVRERSPEKV